MHSCWGMSPPLDLFSIPLISDANGRSDRHERCFLQIAPSDARHTASALGSFSKLFRDQSHTDNKVKQRLRVVTWENEVQALARHAVLVMVLIDDNLLAREKKEIFLEIHSNVRVRPRTSDYLASAGKLLENLLYEYVNSNDKTDLNETYSENLKQTLEQMFDFSKLKYKEKDELANVFRWWSSREACSASLMWDWRLRKLHGERYDSRTNVADWDYHMRIRQSFVKGAPDQDSDNDNSKPTTSSSSFLKNEQAGVIHTVHYRRWRDTGVAYELRDCTHDEANRTLITEVKGRANEYRDRNGDAKGRRVHSIGYWGDVRNPPYFALGIRAAQGEEEEYFRTTNKEYIHNSVDLMERQVERWIHAIDHGCDMALPNAPIALPGADERSQGDDRTDFISVICLSHVKITFVTGSLQKAIINRTAYQNDFDAISVGCWYDDSH